MSIAAILIATARTADGSPIALLPGADGLTLVEWQIWEWSFAGIRDIEVVIDASSDAVLPLISRDGVEPVIAPMGGAASALRAGASAVPRGTVAAVLSFVEQPRPERVVRRLMRLHMDQNAAITRPVHGGLSGTPLMLNDDALAWLRNITDDRGVDALLDRWHDATMDVRFGSDVVLREVRSAEDLGRSPL